MNIHVLKVIDVIYGNYLILMLVDLHQAGFPYQRRLCMDVVFITDEYTSVGSQHRKVRCIKQIVSGPTPKKALFKELVAPPGDFSLMVPVCSQVI